MALKTYKINGEWIGMTAGGCLNHVHWRFNPQVFLKVKERRTVKVKLVQANDNKFYHIGFYVAKTDPSFGQRRQLQLIKDQLVCKAGFDAKKDVAAEVSLEPNEEYFVVLCTFRPREEGRFSCYFTVDGELQIRSLVSENEWKFVELAGEWSGITAGGCRNNPTCSKNPQFLIKTSNKQTEATVILHQNAKEQFDMIGFYLLRTTEKDHKIDKLPSSSEMITKTPFSSSREASARATLPPNGMYSLVVSTFDPGRESQFDVVLFSDEPIKLKELTDRSTIALQGEWRDITAGGSVSYHSWRNNPQFFILAQQKCVVTITLTQNVFTDKVVHPIGFYIAKSSANQALGHRLLIWKQEEVLFKPAAFEMKRSVSTKLALERSTTPYVVIPCAIKPALQKEFTLSVTLMEPPDLNNPREAISVLPCNYTWQLKSLRGRWKGDQAAGSKTNTQLAHNPQYSLKIESQCTVVIIVVVRQKELSTVLCLLRAKDNELIRDVRDEMVLEKSSSSSNNAEETYITRELNKGYYNIIPALSEPNKEALFEVLVYASVEDIEFTHAGMRSALPSVSLNSTKGLTGAYSAGSLSTSGGSSSTAAGSTNSGNVGNTTNTSANTSTTSGPRPVPSATPLHHSGLSASPADVPKHSSSPSLLGGEMDTLVKWMVDLTDLEFHEKIGQGGYGAVFRGTMKHKGASERREVAIKKLVFRDEDEAKEFKKEVLLMSKLMHPKIVAFIGVATDGNEMCILTEFCSRGNVTTILKTTPDLSWTNKLRMSTDAAKGMLYLHSCKPPIVHRDLKSLNLLVDKDWSTKVADFGLSKATSGQSMNSRMGSLNWCAPEILLQSSSYSPEADSYSFGLVLWEFVTHQVPFAGMSPLQIVKIKDTATLPQLPSGVQKDYVQLIKDCCEPKPKHRPNFAQILDRLEVFVRDGVVPYTKAA